MNRRNVAFDMMKGIGIIAMMFCHLTDGMAHHFIHSFHMPLFFLLAGCFAKTNYPPLQGYSQTKKDARRLLLPFVVTMLILSLWGIVQAIIKHDWMLALKHPLSLLWASSDVIRSDTYGIIYVGPLWFLMALFWMREIFYYGGGWILSKVNRWGDELVVICSFLMSISAVLIHPFVDPFPWCIWQGMAAIQFYAIGWYVYRHNIPWWVKALCVVCWPMALRWGRTELDWGLYGCYPLDVLGACGAVWLLFQICEWVNRGTIKIMTTYNQKCTSSLQWIGVNSLTILCMHTLDVKSGIIHSILCRLPFEVAEGYVVVFRMAVTIGLSWVVTMFPRLSKVYR